MSDARILIGLHRGRGLIGRLIQWQTRSVYSHASIAFVEPDKDILWIESREFHGVREAFGKYQESEKIDWYQIPKVNHWRYEMARTFAVDQLGKRYDYTSVMRFLSRRKASLYSQQRWFCSELAFAIAQAAGIDLLERIQPWAVSPGHLSLSTLLEPVDPQDLPVILKLNCNIIAQPIYQL